MNDQFAELAAADPDVRRAPAARRPRAARTGPTRRSRRARCIPTSPTRTPHWAFSQLRPQAPTSQREPHPAGLPPVRAVSIIGAHDAGLNPAWSRLVARERLGADAGRARRRPLPDDHRAGGAGRRARRRIVRHVSLAERSEPFTVEDGLLTDVGGTLSDARALDAGDDRDDGAHRGAARRRAPRRRAADGRLRGLHQARRRRRRGRASAPPPRGCSRSPTAASCASRSRCARATACSASAPTSGARWASPASARRRCPDRPGTP